MHVSYARLPEICKMPTTKSLTREVWEYTSHEELRKEAREIALRVGEIGFTLRVIERIRAQKGGEGESDICAKYLFYADLLDSTSENEIKIKKKKKRFGSTENELNIELSQLFFKLQVLSVVLFGEGKPAHANSEDWVIELIQGVVALAMKSNDEDTFEKIFPIACCYFSIGRRDLFVEQANSLFRTSRKDVGCMLTTWLNAVETYRTHCLDECFWHLLQFFEDGREVVNKQGEKIRSFNEFVQLLIAEKIIGLGIILLNSTKGKSSMQLAKNILKHFSFAKTERDRYTLDVFMREDCSQEKEDAIRSSCRNVLSQVVKSIDSIISGKMKRMYLKNTQMLLMTMLLNAKDKDEIALLKEMYVQMVPKFISGVKAMIKEEMWEENESVRTSCCENDIYPTIIPIELVHNEDCAPNTEQLKKEELRQYKQMATRSRIYRALRGKKVNRRFVQELKVPFDREKCEIANEARSLGYVLSAEEIAKASNTKSVKDAYDLLKKVKGMHMILLNSFYTIKIYNTLDAHYLFTLIERVDGYYTNAIKIFGGAAAGKKETLAVSAREIEENLEKIKKDLLAWKDYIFVPDKKYIEERKAINKLKWIQSSKKKQIIKKGAIKPKVGGFRSGNLKGKVKSVLDKFNKAFNI